MLSETHKIKLQNFIIKMGMDIQWFNSFTVEEQDYIMHLIKNQTGSMGFLIETNGKASEPKSITRFRKRLNNGQ